MDINFQLELGVGLAVVFFNVSDFLQRYSYDNSCEVKSLLGSPQQYMPESKYGIFCPSPNASLKLLASGGAHFHHRIFVILT